MNIILSCYSIKGKGCFLLEKEGKIVHKEVFNIKKEENSTLKEYTFESIIKGLKHAKNIVSHEVLLLIELHNAHLVSWLNGQTEYKGYEDYLDIIFPLIENLDCRYLFSKTDVKKAKRVLEEDRPVAPKLYSALSVFDEL